MEEDFFDMKENYLQRAKKQKEKLEKSDKNDELC